MKFSLSSLKEYLTASLFAEEICEKLTQIGLEVESFEDQSKIYSAFTVAQIIEAVKHENSNKLKICKVEVAGGKILQIICGAPNAREGIKVAYAGIGTIIPTNGMEIKKAKIAGIESSGMLCSADELGLGGDSEGIIEIEEKWQIGDKISDVFAINDAVIEINVTPNRGDCLGVFGVARDLAAAGAGNLKNTEVKKVSAKFSADFEVKNEAESACNYAAFRRVKNVKNCESPAWLKSQLEAAGMNSISAIVDVTNYVMLMLNRPMHAYDANKIKTPITIRFAKDGENFKSLKDLEYKLNAETLTISDTNGVIGMAGIIGNMSSSCDENTNEIILEAAYFDPISIARSGRKFNILSDARHRFERHVDDKTCDNGIEMATALILEICGGEAGEIVTIGKKFESKNVEFDLSQIKKLTNVEVSSDKAEEILEKLEFKILNKNGAKLNVEIPTHRSDISNSADLVEEVIRIFGYDKIQTEKLPYAKPIKLDNKLQKVRSYLAATGLIETINWSFCHENLVKLCDEINEKLILSNPISSELSHMRPNLLIGLLQSYKKNALRGVDNLSLFEIGNVFSPQQNSVIATIRAGKNNEPNHYHDERDFDVFDVKKDAFLILEQLGLNAENAQIDQENLPKYFHPHRAASLKLGKNIIAYFGEIHPTILKEFEIKSRVNYCEVFVDNVPQGKSKNTSRPAFVANDLQKIERDFAFLVNESEAVGNMIRTISGCDKKLITNVGIFDIFSGKNIPEGKKSVAFKVEIQPVDKSMTSEEIDVISQKIITEVEKRYQATLRN